MRRFYDQVTISTLPLREGRNLLGAQRQEDFGEGYSSPASPPTENSLREFSASPSRGEAIEYCVLLDGKPIRTPARAPLALPTRALAEAVAEEWAGQGEEIKPGPLTKLANTAIDRVAGSESDIAAQILAYTNDLLCYRAASPADLVARQSAAWDPLLDWAAVRYARLVTGTGIAHIAQPEETLAAYRAALEAFDAFRLAALHNAATLTGSLVLALALAEGRLVAQEAFALSHLDEIFQTETWGADAVADARARALEAELAATARFLALARP